MKIVRLAWIAVAALVLSPSLYAQVDTGAIVGTVRDPSGGVLPGATVTLTHKQTNISTRTTTDSRGNYEAVGLSIGTYNDDGVPHGIPRRHAAKTSTCGSRTASGIDFKLEVGAAEAVVVTTEAPRSCRRRRALSARSSNRSSSRSCPSAAAASCRWPP